MITAQLTVQAARAAHLLNVPSVQVDTSLILLPMCARIAVRLATTETLDPELVKRVINCAVRAPPLRMEIARPVLTI